MLFGEEAPKTWHAALYGIAGLAAGALPGYWLYLKNKRESEPAIAAKKQRVRAKDETLEQAMYDHLFSKYQTMLEDLQKRVDGFEADRVAYLTANATLKERCESQMARITELLSRNAEQSAKIDEMAEEISRLRSRVEELESQSGGV